MDDFKDKISSIGIASAITGDFGLKSLGALDAVNTFGVAGQLSAQMERIGQVSAFGVHAHIQEDVIKQMRFLKNLHEPSYLKSINFANESVGLGGMPDLVNSRIAADLLKPYAKVSSHFNPMISELASLVKTPGEDILRSFTSISSKTFALEYFGREHEFLRTTRELVASLRPSISEFARNNSHIVGGWGEIESTMLRMTTPWIDSEHINRSATSFAALQSIGRVISGFQLYDKNNTLFLRQELGDFRDRITFTSEIYESPDARRDFYLERGLDISLTDFPEDAFTECLDLVEINRAVPSFLSEFSLPGSVIEGSKLQCEAFKWLTHFETHIRKFIDENFVKVVGEGWEKKRLPGDMYKKWIEKQEKAKLLPNFYPLIAFADFTEYEQIIIMKDNWRDVFQPFFQRKESVIESFQRLYPIRLCIAHARSITQVDLLYLYAEVNRLLSAAFI
jgi:hypothetical protein